MLSLTRKADYTLVAMSELARRAPARASARDIAESIKVPLPMVTNILYQLVNHGLVVSTRGAKGGYCLARDPEDIAVSEVIEAVEGAFRLAACCPDAGGVVDQDCNLEDSCPIREPIRKLHQVLRHCLNQVTLDHLTHDRVPLSLDLSGVEFGAGEGQPAAAFE